MKKTTTHHHTLPNMLHKKQKHAAHIVRSFKAQTNAKRTRSERIADTLTNRSGTMPFLILNTVWFIGWIVINLGWIPGVAAFDPFPFGLLTMVVSLEAIILAIVVLISQNRQSSIGDIREEVDLQMDIIMESEITKILNLVKLLAEKNGINLTEDMELADMLNATNFKEIERSLEKEMMD